MKKIRVCFMVLISLFLFNLNSSIKADRGSIPFRPHVRILEPNQNAILAWNGREEIMALTTDLRATGKTKVLQVLPLPSEPKVKRGSLRSFRRAIHIINRHLIRRARYKYGRYGRRSRGGGRRIPAGKVTFSKKIGSHDIAVTKVLNSKGFVTWVQNYIKSKGHKKVVIPGPLKRVVMEYISDGFKWFVFDIVELDTKKVTNDVIEYRFKTRFLYYPLRITRTETGYTRVKLIILTPYLFRSRDFKGVPFRKIRLPHYPVRISNTELRAINRDIYSLFKRRRYYNLRVWHIYGRLNNFEKDLLCSKK